MQIEEIKNPYHDSRKLQAIKEVQSIMIPDIDNPNIPNRNGFCWCLTGSGGSGKSSLMLSMFKSKKYYRNKFHNIFYICPAVSFSSVADHPFALHEKVWHELTVPILQEIYDQLAVTEPTEKKKGKKVYDDDEDEEDEEEPEIQYSCLIIDDFANDLKRKDVQTYLNKMLIKLRHLKLAVIITLQSWKYCPLQIRKQVTNLSIYKPKSMAEWFSIADEVFNLKKDDALQLYNYIYDIPYAHLDANTVEGKYYKNFNELKLIQK